MEPVARPGAFLILGFQIAFRLETIATRRSVLEEFLVALSLLYTRSFGHGLWS